MSSSWIELLLDCIVGHCQEYNHEAIKQVEIQVGDGTGTDDDVYVEICSDVDNHCCETLFNSWMDDFKSNTSHTINLLCIYLCYFNQIF